MTRNLKWFRSLKKRDFDNGAVLEEIEDVFKRIAELEKAQQWVGVEEQLPEEFVEVLGIDVCNNECWLGWLENGDFYSQESPTVFITNWQSLPPPPRKEG